MIRSELITPQHLNRKAIVYVRQSTPNQILNNQESLELQYALRHRALELGWKEDDIEVIDKDLGITAAGASQREGFKEMVAQVTLQKVGVILSYDVTRLSRNCSDWYPLLDVCGYRGCLIADRDSVYDPSTGNGRLLLGLKGQLAEVELTTIKARMTAGLLNKARRGDLAINLPVGLTRNLQGIVCKNPNREVQHSINFVFEGFSKLRVMTKVVVYMNDNNVKLPFYNRYKELEWHTATISAVNRILKNPAYAGAFVYGRKKTVRHGLSVSDKTCKEVPMEEWRIVIKDKFPAYIDWQVYEGIQARLKDNYAEYTKRISSGIERKGTLLLQGILYCGECGHKYYVCYKNAERYICRYLKKEYGGRPCQNIIAARIDEQVLKAFFEALTEVELDAYESALELQEIANNKVAVAHKHELDRLHYQVKLAERQFNQVDPDNRLVAGELENRWEESLVAFRKAQTIYEERLQALKNTKIDFFPEEEKEIFKAIGKRLPEIWEQLPADKKKAFLRCLIDKVVLHRVKPDCVNIRIIWRGGASTQITVYLPVNTNSKLSCIDKMQEKMLELIQDPVKTDKMVATELTKLGYRSAMGDKVLKSSVQSFRLGQGIIRKGGGRSEKRKVDGYLTIPQAAEKMNVKASWIYDCIYKNRINIKQDVKNKLYLLPDKPEVLMAIAKVRQRKMQGIIGFE